MAHEPSMTGKIAAATSAIALVLAFVACGRREDAAARQADTGFAAMQARGQMVMGVDQYASAHVFEDLQDGGRIVLDADRASDTAGIATIRHHMREIATAFRAGDFARPFEVHAQVVPGTSVMAARRNKITYEPSDRPRAYYWSISPPSSLSYPVSGYCGGALPPSLRVCCSAFALLGCCCWMCPTSSSIPGWS